jgi:hypothetical protein
MYHNKFLKQKTDKNWETYRKQRNLVTKLKKTSIKSYFFERTGMPYLHHHLQFGFQNSQTVDHLKKIMIKIFKASIQNKIFFFILVHNLSVEMKLNYEHLNFNVLVEDKGTPLTTMCDIFDYTNLVKTATCHTKNANPTLIDVILTLFL